nr:tRNA 2-thiouridine(34) synthase MnmA [Candidatus Paceibacterota bacterium]
WQPEFTECTWGEDRLDAMRVAAYLKIPFREIDLSDEYKDEVVADMIDAYRSGITPNPDVLCNERIKFGHFLNYALESGADYVATGHYARNERADGAHVLRRGADANKDQSYFLYRLGQHELAHTLFPVGSLTKPEVRELAEEFGLPNSRKHDSQGLCFVGAVSIPEFLARYIPLTKGSVLDRHGMNIGEHDGAALYTVGQRHGFRVNSTPAHPLYVVAIDTQNNSITVDANAATAAVDVTQVYDLHWSGASYDGEALFVQTRYRELAVLARINGNTIHFDRPHVVTPGQSLVLYADDVCVGGGIAASQIREMNNS